MEYPKCVFYFDKPLSPGSLTINPTVPLLDVAVRVATSAGMTQIRPNGRVTKSMQIPEALMNAVRAYRHQNLMRFETDAVYRLLAIGLEVEAERAGGTAGVRPRTQQGEGHRKAMRGDERGPALPTRRAR